MKYRQLEQLISTSCGEPMKIIDLGASNDLSEYSTKGNSCVAQAFAFAAFPYLKAKEKTLKQVLRNPSKFLNLYSDVSIPLGAIRSKVQKRGAALDQISAMVNPAGVESILTIALWTPSTPTGRLESGNFPKGKAQLNLVIQDYHAMVALPESLVSLIPTTRFRIPADCREQCWIRYRGSEAERLHQIAHPVNACNRNIVYASSILLQMISGSCMLRSALSGV